MENSATSDRAPRRRSEIDKTICLLRRAYYKSFEPFFLKIQRLRFERYFECNVDHKISVYIPTYNRADLLMERAVPSVLSQTYENFELVIVGDGCTDDTENRVSQIKDPRVKFVDRKRSGRRYPDKVELHWLAGPVVAANHALSIVSGDWIARLDDDDIWTSDHLEKLLAFAVAHDFEFVSARCLQEKNGRTIVNCGVGALDPYHTRKEAPAPAVGNPKIGATQTWLYRSYLRFFKYNIDCWRKEWNRVNDIDLSVRIFDAGVRMGFLEEVVAKVIPRPGETDIGIDAYMANADVLSAHFSFN